MSTLMRKMIGPPGLQPSNPHSSVHYEYDSCTEEPPHCTELKKLPVFNSRKPNHFYHDSLGDPATCAEDHNHPDEEQPVAVSADVNSPRASVLDEARTLITGDRNNQYGPPTQDFQRTAALLNALGYVREDAEGVVHPILSSDVALIIAQVKVSRLMHSRDKRDSWVDLAGYAACGYECAEEEANVNVV